MFPVSPEKARALRARMERLAVREEDLEERFIRSRGKGGKCTMAIVKMVKAVTDRR